jgi:purine-cytosine permease-like protein
LICASGASAIINAQLPDGTPSYMPWTVFLVVMGMAVAVIIGDIYVPRKRIDTISAVYFGLLVGVLLTYILSIAAAPLLERTGNTGP